MRRKRHREGGWKARPHAHYRVRPGIRIGKGSGLRRDIGMLLVKLGEASEAYAKVNSGFRDGLHEAIRAFVTNPEDMALFPEIFPPTYRSVH